MDSAFRYLLIMIHITSSPIDLWQPVHPAEQALVDSLEHGNVVFFPALKYELNRELKKLMNKSILTSTKHYISYSPTNQALSGHTGNDQELTQLLQNYCAIASQFVGQLFPKYKDSLSLGHTCLITNDDNCPPNNADFHLDAFPTSPLHGKRILRLFTNISDLGHAKSWQLGEPFSQIMLRFAKKIKKPFVLKLLLSKRSFYDHVMLQLNRMMKADPSTQSGERFDFPANSSWLAFTDQLSHASLNRQPMLAQTFYLPINSLHHPQLSPLTQLENYLDHALI